MNLLSVTHLNRPSVDPIANEISRLAEAIDSALEPVRSNRLTLARRDLADLKDQCATAQREFGEAVAAARAAPGDSQMATARMTAASAVLAALDATRKAARADAAALVEAASPGIAHALAPHLRVGEILLGELLGHIETISDSLLSARRYLTDNKFEQVPRLLNDAPAIAERVRALRLAIGGRP